ncbi:MAG: metal-dependent transcriptional regulator [Oscillospiraceae bacterium]
MKIQQSAEDYLEAVLVLKERLGQVRAIDIANQLKISKPSVSVFIRQLRDKGYLTIEGSNINLTQQGKKVADGILERHNTLTRCLVALGVCEQTAKEDACRIEHFLSEESFLKIKEHCKF